MREPLLDDGEKYPHIIRRASLINSYRDDFIPKLHLPEKYDDSRLKVDIKRIGRLTVEVALFFDETGYKIFAPYFNYDDVKIRNMLLAYLNGVTKYIRYFCIL